MSKYINEIRNLLIEGIQKAKRENILNEKFNITKIPIGKFFLKNIIY